MENKVIEEEMLNQSSGFKTISVLMGVVFTFAFISFLFFFLYKQNQILTITNQNMWFSIEHSKNDMKELEQKNLFLKKENERLKNVCNISGH